MGWLFWVLLVAGIVLVVWPFFAALTTGASIFLWILGALFIIAAFFILPAWWSRPVTATAGGYPGTNMTGPEPHQMGYRETGEVTPPDNEQPPAAA